MPEQTNQVEVGQRFPLTIKRIGINGEGIGYYKRKIVFIPGALPEEVVVAEVTNVAPRFIEAKVHKLRQSSPQRVTPKDATYGQVGGIELEHLSYPANLPSKKTSSSKRLKNSNHKATPNTILPIQSEWKTPGIIATKHNSKSAKSMVI